MQSFLLYYWEASISNLFCAKKPGKEFRERKKNEWLFFAFLHGYFQSFWCCQIDCRFSLASISLGWWIFLRFFLLPSCQKVVIIERKWHDAKFWILHLVFLKSSPIHFTTNGWKKKKNLVQCREWICLVNSVIRTSGKLSLDVFWIFSFEAKKVSSLSWLKNECWKGLIWVMKINEKQNAVLRQIDEVTASKWKKHEWNMQIQAHVV